VLHPVFCLAKRGFAALVLIVWISLSLHNSAHAQIPEKSFTNVKNLEDADRVVENLLERVGGRGEVLLYQAGDRLPGELEWIIKRLAQHKVQVKMVRVNHSDLEMQWQALEGAPAEFQELITFRSLLDSGRKLISSLFGVQRLKDLSLWIPVPRKPEIVKLDRLKGLYAGTTASASLGISYVSSYFRNGVALEPSLAYPLLSLGAMEWLLSPPWPIRS
jgi:hypothetical protein